MSMSQGRLKRHIFDCRHVLLLVQQLMNIFDGDLSDGKLVDIYILEFSGILFFDSMYLTSFQKYNQQCIQAN